MVIKVEGESYNHNYYVTTNPQLDPNGWGTSYDEKKNSDGPMRNGFMTEEANGYSRYDKEMFKRTILAHEAIFRQQVYELHRVYRTQKTLMKQYENQEIHAQPMLEDAHQTHLPASASPDGAKMIGQMQMPPSSIIYRKPTVSVNHGINYYLKFLREGSVQSSPNGFPLTDVALQTKQGTFDLQLPADYSVDDDNSSDNKPTYSLGLPSDTKHQNFVDLTVFKEEGLRRFSDNSSTSGLPRGNKLVRQHVANQNETTSGMYMSKTNGLISRGPSYTLENYNASDNNPIDFLGVSSSSNTKHQYFPDLTLVNSECLGRLKDNSSTSGLTTENNMGRQRVADLNVPIFGMYMGKANGPAFRGPSHTLEKTRHQSVQGPSTASFFFNKKCSNDKRMNDGISSDFFNASSRIRQDKKPLINKGKQVDNFNFFAPRYNDVDFKKTSKAADGSFESSNQLIYQYPYGSAGWFSQSCLEADAINNFSRLKHPNHSSPSTLAQISIPHIDHISVASTMEHSAHQYHDPNFASGKRTKNFNLNEVMSDGQEDTLVEQHGKGGGSASGIHLARKEVACTGLTVLEETRKVSDHSYGTMMEMRNNTDRMETAVTHCNLSGYGDTSISCRINKDKASDDINSKTHLTCNKTQESSGFVPPSYQKVVSRHEQTAEGVINKRGSHTRNFIDLNKDAPNEDDSESSVVSHECHVASLQNNNTNRTFAIDLQVPACEDFAACASHQECPPDDPNVFEEDDTAAAKSILALSMDVQATVDTSESDDMLQWFAEIAVSSTDGRAGQVEVLGCINNCSDDDIDSFESLTLKLEETPTEEYMSKPQAPAIPNNEHTVSTVNLLTKPRRGHERKRRQKRDFQKDILPTISSLSRPEIIDDIQLLEGLVQTSGGSWESSITKKRRNGGRTRGRKPKKQLPVIVEEEIQVSAPSKPDCAGLEAGDRGIVTWGRTTRRCRRPRCMSGNTITAAS